MAMALASKGRTDSFLLLAALLAFLFSAAAVHSYMNNRSATAAPSYRDYILLLWPPKDANAMDKDAHRRWHQSFLSSTLTDSGEPRLHFSYTHVFNGFAARLTDAELEEVAKKPGFLRAFPDRKYKMLVMPGYQMNGKPPHRQRGVRRRRRVLVPAVV